QNETFIVPKEDRTLPLVGKCCPVNEIFVKDANGKSTCLPSNDSSTVFFSPFFSEFNRSGVLVPGDEKEKFVAVVGIPCRYQKYMLYPEDNSDDEYYLMTNGSIFAPRHVPILLMPGEDYCMEVVPKLGLRVFVCFLEDITLVSTDARITIYACGLLISVPFLLLTIAAYMITPRLRDIHGKALCHYCGCLALAFLTLAITQLASSYLPLQVCISIAFVIQFSFVACFFWLNVLCIEIWSLVRHLTHHRAYRRIPSKTLFFYYSIWAWGPSAILILVSMTMELSPTIPMTYVKPTFGENCWFKSDAEAMPYFYVPVGLLLLGNTILFIITAVKISRYQQELTLRRLARNQHSDREDQRLFRRLKQTFIVCLVLFFLMGLNWIMELISWWAGGNPLDWSAFDLVNALQGVLIFGLFVLRRPIRDFVWHRIQKLRGIHTTEPDLGSMDLALLPVINGNSLPRQTVVQ
ncbi:G-protein coupled receptor Mth2, partial [Ooceraea biroi]